MAPEREGRAIGVRQSGVEVRELRPEDEPEVLTLLEAALGPGPAGGRTAEFFRWKHLDNPFGRSFLWVAEADGRIAGLRAFMRWRFVAGGRPVEAVRAVDTATHPDFQRQGIFSRLTREALEVLRERVDLVFNTPNARSGPGYLKLGWRPVGRIRVSVRVRRPVRFVRGLPSVGRPGAAPPGRRPPVPAPKAEDALHDAGEVEALLADADPYGERLVTDRSHRYLRWRYAAASGLGYRALTEDRDGRLRGLAVFRVRPRGSLWECAVAELIVPRGDRAAAARLLRRVASRSGADHVICRFPPGSAAAAGARRAGFLPYPAGPRLVVNPLREPLAPPPADRRSWALSLGDLEAF